MSKYSFSTTMSVVWSTNFLKSSICVSTVLRSLFAPLSNERRAYSPALKTGRFASVSCPAFTLAASVAVIPAFTKSAFLDFLAMLYGPLPS